MTSTHVMELVGQRLGKYLIEAELGHGGMGVVYRAEQTSLGRHVALKVVSEELSGDPDAVARFRREAQAIARLNHPGIVQVHDIEEVDGRLFLVMELVDGESLDRWLARPLALDRTLEIGAEIADALHAAHEKGVVHRDVKPANILMTAAGRPKVADFGLAHLLDSEAGVTKTGTLVGSPAYMSPEQALGRIVDRRGDVYSLGVVLFRMVTGRVPFIAESSYAVLRMQIDDPPPDPRALNAEVPLAVRDVVLKALAKRPEDRFRTMAALRDSLRACRDSPGRPDQSGVEPTRALSSGASHAARPAETEETAALPALATTAPGTLPPETGTPPTRTKATVALEARIEPSVRVSRMTVRALVLVAGLGAVVGGTLFLLRRQVPTGIESARIPPQGVETRRPAMTEPTRPPAEPSATALAAPQALPTRSDSADPSGARPTPIRITRASPAPEVATPKPVRGEGGDLSTGAASDAPTSRPAQTPSIPLRYCPALGSTSFVQSKTRGFVPGFGTDTGPMGRRIRPDSGRIQIAIQVDPPNIEEGRPFTVKADLVNEGIFDVELSAVEETIHGSLTTFRTFTGFPKPSAVPTGRREPIYAFEGELHGSTPFVKSLRVVDAQGDAWTRTLEIWPCD